MINIHNEHNYDSTKQTENKETLYFMLGFFLVSFIAILKCIK